MMSAEAGNAVTTPAAAVTTPHLPTRSPAATSNSVNINPKAEDCYYYFYSSCSKVCTKLSVIYWPQNW